MLKYFKRDFRLCNLTALSSPILFIAYKVGRNLDVVCSHKNVGTAVLKMFLIQVSI